MNQACHVTPAWNILYIKAPTYVVLSNMDLADACFLIWSKAIWDTRIYVLKALNRTFFDDFAITMK